MVPGGESIVGAGVMQVDVEVMLEIQRIAENRSRWSRAMRRIRDLADSALGTERCSQGYATERRFR